MIPTDKGNKTILCYNLPIEDVFNQLQTTTEGLKQVEVDKRLRQYGSNIHSKPRRTLIQRLFPNQFKNNLIIIILFAALISIYLRKI